MRPCPQWSVSAYLMKRVMFHMVQHLVEEHHSEQLERLLKYYNYAYVVLAPPLWFAADWVIPTRFLVRYSRTLK